MSAPRRGLLGLRRALRASCLAVAWGAAAFAHHPISGKFDTAATARLAGVVTSIDWRNPHAHVFMNVEADGRIANWAVELASPIDLHANGWSDRTVAPGDHLVVDGPRARDGSRQIWGGTVTRASSGQRLFVVSTEPPPRPLEPRPAPRWPDGTPALGATSSTDNGFWGYPSATALVEDGVEVAMNADGLLANLGDARRVAPLQPWALGVYRHRQSRALQDDPMFLNCKPPGGPRQYQSHLGIKLLEDRANERIFVLIGSGNHNYRIIYLDGRDHLGQVGGDDDNPLYYGRSVGSWDGDTLVVETVGFNEDFWFTNGGLPHTSFLRMTERFSRPDFDTLRYQVTIDDPGAYTRPWTASWALQWVGGQELPAHFCQNNRP